MEINDFVSLLGGVALFLFGMTLMGDGLKKAAGSRMEAILNRLSGTSVKGILLGTGVTALIQSSSATSIMAIGFVNSGMMKQKQAVSIIMGAIIGTSITGWIICLSELGGSSSALSLLSTETISAAAAVAGILMVYISKKKSLKDVASILLGFSVLMFGMKTMSGSAAGLRNSPAMVSFMTDFSSPLLGVFAGAAAAAVLQSASAAVGILQALSVTGTMTFGLALPVIMGISIGASLPVLIAAAGSEKEGKRTALSYLVIELIRVALFAAVFYGIDAAVHFGFMQRTVHMVDIALANTLFRVSTILVLSPFSGLIVRITKHFIRTDPEEEERMRDFDGLQDSFLVYPTIALEQARAAVLSMARLTRESLIASMAMLTDYSEKQFREVAGMENLCDKFEDRIGNYLAKLTARDLSVRQSAFVNQYLRVIGDFERMADHAMNIAERAEEIDEKKIQFTESGYRELKDLTDIITEIVTMAIDCMVEEDLEKAYRVEPAEEIVDGLTLLVKNNHIRRVQLGECTIDKGYVFNDLLTDFERISDHCSNVAISVVELKGKQHGAHEISDTIKAKHTENYDRWFEYYKKKYYDAFV